MSDLPSVKQKVQTESTRYLSSVSEFLVQTVGKSINWLIDHADATDATLAALFTGEAFNNHGAIDSSAPTWSYTAPSGKYLTAVLQLAGTYAITSVSCTGFMQKFDAVSPISSEAPTLPVRYFIKLAPGESVSVSSSGGAGLSSRTLIGALLESG